MPRLPPRAAVRAVLRLRTGLGRLADRLVPADFALFDQALGVARTQVIGALAELGVPDALASGPATAAELAPRLGADADTLHRLGRAAAAYGLLRLDGRGRLALTRTGRTLQSGAPDTTRAWARYLTLESTQAGWRGLTESVRTGAPAFARANGRSVWDHFAAHPEEGALFAEAMRRATEYDLPGLVAGYPWPERGRVGDVAGGTGALLAAVLRARPGVRGVLVDRPEVLARAEDRLEAAGLCERVELVPGDLFAPAGAQADVYLLKDVLHDWDDATCGRILAGVAAAMRAGARLVVVERTLERTEADPLVATLDLLMLTQCDGGRQRSVAELHALFRAAGLEPGPVRRTPGPALVEAVRPG